MGIANPSSRVLSVVAGAALTVSALTAAIHRQATSRLSETDLVASVRDEVERRTSSDTFSGSVLVAKHGRPILAAAYGLADRERQARNTVDTRFRIGSMNKMFTAVAIFTLVEAGKVALDDPLGKYLRDDREPEVRSKVTLRHLLTHTGGTGDGAPTCGAAVEERPDAEDDPTGRAKISARTPRRETRRGAEGAGRPTYILRQRIGRQVCRARARRSGVAIHRRDWPP